MKRKGKILLATAIGVFLLAAVIGAALNAVFTVTDVKIGYATLSDEGVADCYALQEELEEKYVGSSTTFLDLGEVEEIVRRYPAFRAEKIEKHFPATLSLTLTERKETYAFARQNGKYAVLDETGLFLYEKEENLNRRGGENILLEGFEFTGEEGETVGGKYFTELLTFCGVFAESLGDVRANLTSVSLISAVNETEGVFRLRLKEGVYVDVFNPSHLTKQKAESVLSYYQSLSDMQKLYGFFDVVDYVGGGFTVSKHRDKLPF